jgi:hypothetical protein
MPAAGATRHRRVESRRAQAVAARPAAARVTAVAITARTKMLRKHGAGRVFLANIAWEIPMPFSKPLPSASPQSRNRALHLIDQHIVSAPTLKSDNLQPPRRTIQAAVSRLMAEAVAFSAHAASAAPGVPIAIVSWLIPEILAGCAAYGRAMYSFFPLDDEGVDCGDPVPPASHPVRAPRPRPVLSVVSGTAERGVERDEAARRDSRWE